MDAGEVLCLRLDKVCYCDVFEAAPGWFLFKNIIASSSVSDVYEDKIFVIYGDKVSIIRAVGESSLSK